MFDGWTDKHKKYPYLGLRIAYVNKNWVYMVMTVSCKVLEKHTAQHICDHVKQEMALICLDMKTVQVFSAHDGAANMIKASKILRITDFQHCIAHAMHLLLMTDGIGRSSEIIELLQRCKDAISKLLFKSCLLNDEVAKTQD